MASMVSNSVSFVSKWISFPFLYPVQFYHNLDVLEAKIFAYSKEYNKESFQLVSPHTQCQFCLPGHSNNWYTLVSPRFVKHANLYCVTKIGK